MPISGPVVHQQLMDTYNHSQQQYEAERAGLADAKAHRDKLDTGRDEALVELAQFYLPT